MPTNFLFAGQPIADFLTQRLDELHKHVDLMTHDQLFGRNNVALLASLTRQAYIAPLQLLTHLAHPELTPAEDVFEWSFDVSVAGLMELTTLSLPGVPPIAGVVLISELGNTIHHEGTTTSEHLSGVRPAFDEWFATVMDASRTLSSILKVFNSDLGPLASAMIANRRYDLIIEDEFVNGDS
jgi:hypothetical protein